MGTAYEDWFDYLTDLDYNTNIYMEIIEDVTVSISDHFDELKDRIWEVLGGGGEGERKGEGDRDRGISETRSRSVIRGRDVRSRSRSRGRGVKKGGDDEGERMRHFPGRRTRGVGRGVGSRSRGECRFLSPDVSGIS